MRYRLLALASVTPWLIACSTLHADNSRFRVDSEPAGAQVYVMGELAGVTPLDISVAQVFPPVFPQDKKALYGQIVLKKEPCAVYQTTVDSAAIARGLHAKLSCASAAPAIGATDVKARLDRLGDLRRDGTISEEEYAEQRRRILSEL